MMCNGGSWLVRILPFFLPLACYAAAADDHRVVVYYQTTNFNNSITEHVSLLPLINSEATVSVTHVLVAAFHIVDDGVNAAIKLNDYPPDNAIFDQVWSDVAQLQAAGVIVTGMVGGAAQGSYERLDGNDTQFEKYYAPLHDTIGQYNLQGLDLDVEESMSLDGIIRLIDRLKADFGDGFVITLAPVAAALQKGGGNLSGFSYFDLEAQRGSLIDFYNAQFYFGWGDASSSSDYEDIVDSGFPAEKVTMGLLTNPDNGNGFVALDTAEGVIGELTAEYPIFGGVAGWEYFNSLPGGEDSPWEWASFMADHMSSSSAADTSSAKFRAKRVFHDAWHVVRRWKREVWRLMK